jgi:6,7-dimethyl-8-ribityllumazine synthase
MATSNHNLSDYDINTIPSTEGMKFGIVVSQWNDNITGALLKGALRTLKVNGVADEDIQVMSVPGSFELTYGSQLMTKTGVDAVIAIGCVIRGDTPHFDYICEGTTNGLAYLNASQDVPVIYGLITTNNIQQALDRCGGQLGNKGDEAAVTAIKMADFRRKMREQQS